MIIVEQNVIYAVRNFIKEAQEIVSQKWVTYEICKKNYTLKHGKPIEIHEIEGKKTSRSNLKFLFVGSFNESETTT